MVGIYHTVEAAEIFQNKIGSPFTPQNLSMKSFCVVALTPGSSKNPPQERKSTPTPREMSATKSPNLQGVPDQQTYERLLQGLGAADVYRQIPIAFDPASLPRGIAIDPGTATVRLA